MQAPPVMEELTRSQAHVWYLWSDQITDRCLLGEYEKFLNDAEIKRWRKFSFPEGKKQFLVTRALIRTVLSRYVPVRPEDWQFSDNAYGRPEIAGPANLPPLRFNISHTKGLVVWLVALGREVGIDVEYRERRGRLLEIADRFFSTAEVKALRALPQGKQRRRFLELWTLKESYIKARGMGLALRLSGFSFHLDYPSIRLEVDLDLNDDPERWQFELLEPGPQHIAALCLDRGKGSDMEIKVRKIVPLA